MPDYHDYVFKDGKFVGDFEKMYQESTTEPWHQGEITKTWHGKISLDVIEAAFGEGAIDTILEVGCGHGHISKYLKNLHPEFCFYGFDISPTAVKNLNGPHFYVDDLLNLKFTYGTYNLVLCKEVLWYVAHDLDTALNNLYSLVSDNGYLYIGLSFPRLDKLFVGKETIPNPAHLLARVEKDFATVAHALITKGNHPEDGPSFLWVGKKK